MARYDARNLAHATSAAAAAAAPATSTAVATVASTATSSLCLGCLMILALVGACGHESEPISVVSGAHLLIDRLTMLTTTMAAAATTSLCYPLLIYITERDLHSTSYRGMYTLITTAILLVFAWICQIPLVVNPLPSPSGFYRFRGRSCKPGGHRCDQVRLECQFYRQLRGELHDIILTSSH